MTFADERVRESVGSSEPIAGERVFYCYRLAKVAEVRPVYANGDLPERRKVIERSFPFVEISEIAERQSWRKDVYQPVYYIHKWWAS